MEFLAPPSIWGVRGADSVDSGESVSLGGDIAPLLPQSVRKKEKKGKERKRKREREERKINSSNK